MATAFDKDREVPVKEAPGSHLSNTSLGSGDQKVSATISQDTLLFGEVSVRHDSSLGATEVDGLLQYSNMAVLMSLFTLVLPMIIY